MKHVIVMPVYNPDEKMTIFVDSLLEAGFDDIVMVNDGSREDTLTYFEQAAAHPEVTLLVHEVNGGKGKALKTAFSYLAANRQDVDMAITVDGDGQHNVDCINSCLAAADEHPGTIILGGRDFADKNIPARSRVGNKISATVYRFAIGVKLNDTQTGLRVIPAKYFEPFSGIKGDRYEYETNMLVTIANLQAPYLEVPIETIYIDDNASSHFNPIKDSVKIYLVVLKNFFKFMISSILSWLVDIGLFTLLVYLLEGKLTSEINVFGLFKLSTNVLVCTAAARVVSSIVNFIINRKTVFKSADNVASTAVRYYILVICQLLASSILVDIFAVDLLNVTGILETVVKCIVDICLFIASYGIQRGWVFKNKKAD